MEIEKRLFEREEKRILKEKRAIVFHWPAGREAPALDRLWLWMNRNSVNSYHYFISKQFNCLELEDLKQIYINLQAIKKNNA